MIKHLLKVLKQVNNIISSKFKYMKNYKLFVGFDVSKSKLDVRSSF